MSRDSAPIWINGVPFYLDELGDIAGMGLAEAMEALFDRGYFGPTEEGETFWDRYREQDMGQTLTLMSCSEDDPEMVQAAWKALQDYEVECEQLRKDGTFAIENKEQLIRLRNEFEMRKKLCSAD